METSKEATIPLPKEQIDLENISINNTHFGTITLSHLNGINLRKRVNDQFPECLVEVNNGVQDGPAFKYFTLIYDKEPIANFNMSGADSLIFDHLYIESKRVIDKYNVRVGSKIDSLMAKNINIHLYADAHYNIFANYPNSKVNYLLEGDFKMLNDSMFTAKDYSIEKWQVKGMKVHALLWRK